MTDTARRYQFPALDRSGWLLGLTGIQCVALAAGLLGAGVLVPHSPPGAFAVAVAAASFAFASWEGQRLYEWLPIAITWLERQVRGETTWHRPLHALRDRDLVLPRAWGPTDAVTADEGGRGSGAAVVVDRRQHTYSITFAASGRGFALADRADQERLLAGWGDVLAGFCGQHQPVARLTVSEWAGPSGIDDLTAHASRQVTAAHPAAGESYRELLAAAGPAASRHETLLTLTVHARSKRGPREDGIAIAVEHARLLASRLDAVGIDTSAPLNAAQLATVLRARLDPQALPQLRARSVSPRGNAPTITSAGPVVTGAAWEHVTTDTSTHRVYWVGDWPRLPVGPAWLEPLLLHAGGTRTFTVVIEPVPTRLAVRQIRRDATRLASDQAQRQRAGWRIAATHHRASDEVSQREEELAAGHAEVTYVGFLTVTAPDTTALLRSCVDYEDAAAHAGLELRRLDGRHDRILAAALLPLGRPVPEPRVR